MPVVAHTYNSVIQSILKNTDAKTLHDVITLSFEGYSDQPLLHTRRQFRTQTWTYGKILTYFRKLDAFYQELGVQPRDNVLVIGPNSPEYAAFLLGNYYTNHVVVPADVRSSPELIEKYIQLVEPSILFTSRLRTRDITSIMKNYLILEDLFNYLDEYKPSADSISAPEPDDVAEVVFTSGTTGQPKGVRLTHNNIVSNLRSLHHIIPPMDEFHALSILPLSHMFEQIVGLLIPVTIGASIYYPEKINAVAMTQALQEREITHLAIVPQILKNIFQSIEHRVEEQNRRVLFDRMLSFADYLPLALRRLLFRSVHKQLGGNLKFIAIGGAKPDYRIIKNWERMGFPIIEGYGATEVTAGATGNTIDDRETGSAGRPLPDVQIKIDENDEIMIKGPNVSPGYYKNPKKTARVFSDDGWYRTGDMGKLENGRLYLFGRDAFKIVLSSGENVYVEDLESSLNVHPAIRESCVVAREHEGQDTIHAAILPDTDATSNDIDNAVKQVNEKLETHQQITSHSLWPDEDFPRTPTLKINRKLVTQAVEKYTQHEQPHRSGDQEADTRGSELIEIIADISRVDPVEISDDTNLGSDLGISSIDRLELIAMVETRFDVFIDDYAVSAQTTIGNLQGLIQSAQKAPNRKLLDWKYFQAPISYLRLALLKLIFFPLHGLFVKTRVNGLENLRGLDGPAFLFFNHIGPFDSIMVMRQLTNKQLLRTANAAQQGFWENDTRIDEILIQLLGGGFPVSAINGGGTRAGLERIGRLLDKNFIIVLAPEGRMSRTGRLQRLRRGAGLIASAMNVPVVPIKFKGDYTSVFQVPRDDSAAQPLTSFFPKPKRTTITLEIGQPLDLSGVQYNKAAEIIEHRLRSM